jgi:hypothetical protein
MGMLTCTHPISILEIIVVLKTTIRSKKRLIKKFGEIQKPILYLRNVCNLQFVKSKILCHAMVVDLIALRD